MMKHIKTGTKSSCRRPNDRSYTKEVVIMVIFKEKAKDIFAIESLLQSKDYRVPFLVPLDSNRSHFNRHKTDKCNKLRHDALRKKHCDFRGKYGNTEDFKYDGQINDDKMAN